MSVLSTNCLRSKTYKNDSLPRVEANRDGIFNETGAECREQVFVVFLSSKESEKVDLENLQMGYNRIFRAFLHPYQISVVHSK
jgi:hypothetical protein